MLFFSIVSSSLLPLAAASPIQRADPFVGKGTINVVDGRKIVGCLTNAGQFTTNLKVCGAFNGTVYNSCSPWGCSGNSYTFTSPSGLLAPIFRKGSQYEEGGNGVLECSSAGFTSDKKYFTLAGGVNDQIGMTLLEDSNGADSFNTIRAAGPSAMPQDLQDNLVVPGSGTSYALTWTGS